MSTKPENGAFGAGKQWLIGIVVVGLAALAFGPGLSGDFIFDDGANILDRPAGQIENLSLEEFGEAAGAYGGWPVGRPLATISLGLDWYFWGDNATGFKITNLVLHLLNVLLSLLLARRLLDASGPRSATPPWPAVSVNTALCPS